MNNYTTKRALDVFDLLIEAAYKSGIDPVTTPEEDSIGHRLKKLKISFRTFAKDHLTAPESFGVLDQSIRYSSAIIEHCSIKNNENYSRKLFECKYDCNYARNFLKGLVNHYFPKLKAEC